MEELSRLLFKAGITTLATSLLLIIVPVVYIICTLFAILWAIGGDDFAGLFNCLNNTIKTEVLDLYITRVKELWKL